MQPINLGQQLPAAPQAEPEICPFTLEAIVQRATIPCGHAFEADEISKWAATKNFPDCPTCRAPFQASQIKTTAAEQSAARVEEVAPAVIANTQHEPSEDFEMPRLVYRERNHNDPQERDALVAGLAMFIMAIVAVVGSVIQFFINNRNSQRVEHSFSHFQRNPAFSINHLSQSILVND